MSTLRESVNDLLAVTVDEQIERIACMAVVGFANQHLEPETAELVQRVLDALPPTKPEVNRTVMWNVGDDAPTTFLIGLVVADRVTTRDDVPARTCRIKINALITTWMPSERLYVIK